MKCGNFSTSAAARSFALLHFLDEISIQDQSDLLQVYAFKCLYVCMWFETGFFELHLQDEINIFTVKSLLEQKVQASKWILVEKTILSKIK